MAERARNDPGSFGFTDISTPCQGSAGCGEYVFWDDIHPTTAAHARLAEAALGVLSVRNERMRPLLLNRSVAAALVTVLFEQRPKRSLLLPAKPFPWEKPSETTSGTIKTSLLGARFGALFVITSAVLRVAFHW